MTSPTYVPVIRQGVDVSFNNVTVAGTLKLTPGGAIEFGPTAGVTDTFLYRSGANALRTDGALTVGTNVRIIGNLGVGNSAAAALGTVVRKVQIFDSAGASLGFLPVYDAIT